jgi:catecholate siderophore receptor
MSSSLIRVSLLGLPLIVVSVSHAANDKPAVLPKIQVQETLEEGYKASAAQTAKTDTPLRDVPQSISVITRQTLDDLSTQNIGEAMQYVPGVSMAQGEGNRETPVIRGNSTTGDFFLDGMRDDVQYYRDLYNVQQVEVLKGPNGALFGRGGVGGLINRVSKQAVFDPVRSVSLQFGSYENKRVTADFGQGLSDSVAFRVNGVYEDSDSYRDDVTLERYGINPTMTFHAGERTTVTAGVEYFHDERTADRGVPSYQGRPLDTRRGEFFGDPDQSPVEATVKMANLFVEHRFSDTFVLRNRTRYSDYDKFYQNVFPGAVNGSGTLATITAYNNDTQRENFFNQTDLHFTFTTGAVTHKFLAGLELGRQETENFRQTGYFDTLGMGTTSIQVPITNPRTTLPVAWRQSATDADNEGTAKIAALYLHDEIALSPKFLVVAGLRYDRFKMDFTNNRTATDFGSKDDLFSPRLALVYKPIENVSTYASYSLTYQPRAGDQLASLSAQNSSLDPEKFINYEVGVKWDANPDLAVTAAVFQLERKKVAVADPDDATRLMLVDGQRNRGAELGLTGHVTDRWSVIAAAAYQDAEITSDQSAAIQEGARLAHLPKATFSLWNRYEISDMWGVGLGVVRKGDVFAATENIDNPAANVKLPSYTRVDGAVYFTLNDQWRAQLNIENLFNKDYFQYAHNNNNITPGSPRAARLTVTASF